MIWILGAVLLGSIIGYISYTFQKAFLGMIVLGAPIFALIYFKVFMPLVRVSGLSDGNPISVMRSIYGAMTPELQSATLILPMAAFGGRILTWFHAKFIAKTSAVETQKQRKDRILKEYGYKNGLPY